MGPVLDFFWYLTDLEKSRILTVYALLVTVLAAYFFSLFLRQNSKVDRTLKRQTLSGASSDSRDLFAPRVLFYCLLLLGPADYVLYYGSALYAYAYNFDPELFRYPCFGTPLYFVNSIIGTAGYLVDAALLLLLDYLFAETLNAAVLPGRSAQRKLEKRLRFAGRLVVAGLYLMFYAVWVRDLITGYFETPDPLRSRGCVDRSTVFTPLADVVDNWAHTALLVYLTASFGVLFVRNILAARSARRFRSAMYTVRLQTIRRLRYLTIGNVSAMLVIAAFTSYFGPGATARVYLPFALTALVKNGAIISYYAVNSAAFIKLRPRQPPCEQRSPLSLCSPCPGQLHSLSPGQPQIGPR
jgi:hypothetical protein